MKSAKIQFSEENGIKRVDEPVSFGVPFSRGDVENIDDVILSSDEEYNIVCHKAVMSLWGDGSVRWARFDFNVNCEANHNAHYKIEPRNDELSQDNSARKSPTLIAIKETVSEINVIADDLEVALSTTLLNPFRSVKQKGVDMLAASGSGLELYDSDGNAYAAVIKNTDFGDCRNAVKQDIVQVGCFRDSRGRELCQFESVVSVFAKKSTVRWKVSIHNPRAAMHESGLWDLGRSGSVFFDSLNVKLKLKSAAASSLQIDDNIDWLTGEKHCGLYQDSSGGEQWQHRNHVNKDGDIPLNFRGYECKIDDQVELGFRASPIIYSDKGISVCIENFWQNFPKSLSIKEDLLQIELFPGRFKDHFELQGGERKTHTLYIDFSGDKEALAWTREPLNPKVDAEYYASTGALQNFTNVGEPLDRLIEEGLSDDNGFYAKREVIDEYGWRNFGDIFADHESLYLKNEEIYVSHYNNQYDPIYGFLRQFISTGEPQWKALADDLAKHVVDIDIYNSVEDRAEYNGGLFWHTDHYVDAFTASHRTYSRFQRPDGVNATLGGGPGGQHCYTHGLLLHYYLTGSEASKNAVLQLAAWISFSYEGTGSLIECLLNVKNKRLVQLRCANSGLKVSNHKYPLDRGVGNYIVALLDCLEITSDGDYLERVERIIQGTVHPADVIEDRRLDDVEETWFYTVFLQAVIRYLGVKERRDETVDSNYQYAVDSLFLYARWMLENERPYLDIPEILDFPNDTWVAQDIRKANILFYMASRCPDADEAARFKAKAEYFYRYVVDSLTNSDEKYFSRILAILMQNYGTYGDKADQKNWLPMTNIQDGDEYQTTPYIDKNALIKQMINEMLRAIGGFSLRKELRWLKYRHPVFAKLYRLLYRD